MSIEDSPGGNIEQPDSHADDLGGLVLQHCVFCGQTQPEEHLSDDYGAVVAAAYCPFKVPNGPNSDSWHLEPHAYVAERIVVPDYPPKGLLG